MRTETLLFILGAGVVLVSTMLFVRSSNSPLQTTEEWSQLNPNEQQPSPSLTETGLISSLTIAGLKSWDEQALFMQRSEAYWQPLQMENEISLLEAMLADANTVSDPRFAMTPYWKAYSEQVKNSVKTRGLENYRSQAGDNGGKHFGAAINSAQSETVIRSCVDFIETLAANVTAEKSLRPDFFLPIPLLNASLVGVPAVTRIGYQNFHGMYLETYLRIVEAVGVGLDFSGIDNYVEIGAGIGQQVELIAQVFPRMSVYTFDLPTQAYITNRFLSRTFPGRFVDYETIRKAGPIRSSTPGSIMCFPNYRVVDLDVDGDRTVFFNTASFEEMPLTVVKSYLDIIASKRIKYIFLWEWEIGFRKGNAKTAGLGDFINYDDHLQQQLHYVKLGQKPVLKHFCGKPPQKFVYAVWQRADSIQ